MGGRAALSALAAVLAAAGCVQSTDTVPDKTPPQARAAPEPPRSPRPPAALRTDPESEALRAYYTRVQAGLEAQGLLRRDGGGPDTPYDADRLAETFLQLAFYEEYAPDTGVLIARETRSRLHRWTEPVRIETRFGRSVPAGERVRDRGDVARFAGRLSRAANHPISAVPQDGNFVVYIVNEAERRALGPELSALVPGMGPTALDSVLNLPRSSYCLVFAADREETGGYSRAVAIIRAEHPPLLRLSCIHEEVAQGLGLANDSPRARPSIFNDDEEFALLTTMDEQLLRILYDPRLKPGMSEEEARPMVFRIAQEIMGAQS